MPSAKRTKTPKPPEYVPEPPVPGWGAGIVGGYNDRHLCNRCGTAYEQHLGGLTCPPTSTWGHKLPDVRFSDSNTPDAIRADLEAAATWWRKSGTTFSPR